MEGERRGKRRLDEETDVQQKSSDIQEMDATANDEDATDKWDEEEEEEEEESEDEKEIQVDFEFADIIEEDFAAVKRFLLNYLENEPLNATELADFILGQGPIIGSTIKVADSAEVYGFISVLNMHQHQNKESVQQIWKYLMKNAPNTVVQEQLRELFENTNHPLGLILNERMVNVPSELAPHLHRSLFEEIAKAQEEKEPMFQFEYYLLITSLYNQSAGENSSEPTKKKAKVGNETFYFKAEDEIYMKEGTFYFTFPIQRFEQGSRWTLDGMMVESKLVVVLHKSKIPRVLEQLQTLFAGE